MTETVKVQRPLHSTDPNAPWLIYAKGHKRMTEVPSSLVPASVKSSMGGDYKAYFTGAWSSIVGWGLSERVEDQDW